MCGTRAATGGRPYDYDNAVYMIEYDNECIDIGARIMDRDFIPDRLDHHPRIVQPPFNAYDFPKQAFPVLGADGDEIGPGLGIIVDLQSNGTAVVNVGIVFTVPTIAVGETDTILGHFEPVGALAGDGPQGFAVAELAFDTHIFPFPCR